VIVTLILVAALVLAAIDEIRADGRSLLGWAVVLTDAVLLWPRLGI
jgi:hypothetical protein